MRVAQAPLTPHITLAAGYRHKPFEFCEYSSSDFQQEIDPENNFFNSLQVATIYKIFSTETY